MTTFAGARSELATALAGVGNGATSAVGKVAVPYVLLAGGGADTGHVMRGAVESTWRVILVAGKWEADGSAGELDDMKQETLEALRDLAGWQIVSLGTDGQRVLGVDTNLSAELRCVRMIDI